MNFDLSKMAEKQVKIGDTTFHIGKLNAMKGFRLLESLREQLGIVMSNMEVDELKGQKGKDDKFLKEILKTILKLPAVYVDEKLIPVLFDNIQFSQGDQIKGLKLHGAEDMAFTDPLQVYEILARALCVNFYSSFAGKLSALSAKD